MSAEEWFVLSSSPKKTTEVRAWNPGDGLSCSNRTSRSRIPCGAPVATMRTVALEAHYYPPGGPTTRERIRNSVICEHHLANALSGAGYQVPGITTEAEKEAREAVLANHWQEYQDEIHKRAAEKRETQLAKLPDSLRATLAKVSAEQDAIHISDQDLGEVK